MLVFIDSRRYIEGRTSRPSISQLSLRLEANVNVLKTILCIEDDKDCCELIEFVLEMEGFQVVSCATSEEGLRLAKKGNFSAIVLDHRLADISGVEICRQIRIYDKRTPIIFYTATAYPKDREAALAAGANAYLVKPNDFEKIPETIKRLTSGTLKRKSVLTHRQPLLNPVN